MSWPGLDRTGPKEKPVTLDLSSPDTGHLAANDISVETAREMQASKLADARKGLLWKVPLYVAGMAGLGGVYVTQLDRPFKTAMYAFFATAWFAGELFQLYRLSTIDPKRRLIEDELRKD